MSCVLEIDEDRWLGLKHKTPFSKLVVVVHPTLLVSRSLRNLEIYCSFVHEPSGLILHVYTSGVKLRQYLVLVRLWDSSIYTRRAVRAIGDPPLYGGPLYRSTCHDATYLCIPSLPYLESLHFRTFIAKISFTSQDEPIMIGHDICMYDFSAWVAAGAALAGTS